MEAIELIYIDDANVTQEDYLEFLEQHYQERAIYKFGTRREWYGKKEDYKILLAIADGEIVGQSCAYKDIAFINGKEASVWWGCDNFVLPKTRGKGIGKKLQKKLHEDLPNFSSAWYSPINGIIKSKCGSKSLFDLAFAYYPVSTFFTIYLNKVIKKLLKKEFNLKIPLPFFYTLLNKCFGHKEREIKETAYNDSIYGFIANSTLDEFDFYTKRDKEYLNWRYNENPNLRYYAVEACKGNETDAVILFTHAHTEKGITVTKILDVFKRKGAKVSNKDVLIYVATFFKKKRITIDGIQFIGECNYYPRQINKTSFLSTANIKGEIRKPYISYSDQDMTQMY